MRVELRPVIISDSENEVEVMEHHKEVVRALYRKDSVVPAVKFIRAEYALGLKEAKDYCDALCQGIVRY